MLGKKELPSESAFISSDNRWSVDVYLTAGKKEVSWILHKIPAHNSLEILWQTWELSVDHVDSYPILQ